MIRHPATRSAPPDAPDGAPADASAPVLEVFASIQGEGRYAGEPQVLLRLAGCPLRCSWCDTPHSWSVPAVGATEQESAAARIARPGAPYRAAPWTTPFGAAVWVAEVEEGPPRTVSVTGGEPLVWPGFVIELGAYLGPRRLHLETAGAHPDALERVLPCVDHVSLDLKLPDDLDAPVDAGLPADDASWARARRRCLELVASHDACAKIVVAGGRDPARFVPLLDDVAEHAPALQVFLQPVTATRRVAAPDGELLLDLVELALARHLSVRAVPQLHPVLGLA